MVKPARSVKNSEVVKPVEPHSRLHWFPSAGAPRLIAVGLVLLALGALIGWAVAAFSPVSLPSQQRPAGDIVMISGRDDHGLLRDSRVKLQRGPDDETAVGFAANGSFARVVEQRGEWLKVQLVEDAEGLGWVNDFYLRGRMLRTDGGGQVDLADARIVEGKLFIGVRPVADSSGELVWIDPSALQEIGAQ